MLRRPIAGVSSPGLFSCKFCLTSLLSPYLESATPNFTDSTAALSCLQQPISFSDRGSTTTDTELGAGTFSLTVTQSGMFPTSSKTGCAGLSAVYKGVEVGVAMRRYDGLKIEE